ncbi:MAG: DUF664 domain-containing protein [Micromonosporaceae bacterium]
MPPVRRTGRTIIGMLKHLALSDEHYWFRCAVNGEPLDYFPPGPNADWQVDESESAEAVFALYRDEIERSNTIIAATELDAPPRQPDAWWAESGMDLPDLRSILMHVLTETAVHAGHLDAVRELIDGRQWIAL